MPGNWIWLPLLGAGLAWAADEPWKSKKAPEWTEEDAKLVLSASPWAKGVKPHVSKSPTGGSRTVSRTRSGGYPGGGIYGGAGGREAAPDIPAPPLTVRWISARPVRLATVKANEAGTPAIDDKSYVLGVYGIPRTITSDDAPQMAAELKKHAVLKCDGKKEIRPADVQVVVQEAGMVVVYLFPKTVEITKNDKRIEFDASIGQFKFAALFVPGEMVFEGRPEF